MIAKSGNIEIPGLNGRGIVMDYRYKENSNQKPLILFCHGFKGFKDWGHFNLIADEFAKKNFILLKFNFSFNGGTFENPIDFPDLEAFGNNNHSKELDDVSQVVKYVQSESIALPYWNGKIYILGHSKGGGLVSVAASQNSEITKLATWASISDFNYAIPKGDKLLTWKDEGVQFIKNGRTKQNMPIYYQFVRDLQTNSRKLSIQKAVENLEIPHLIIHGTLDDSVDIKNARLLKLWNNDAHFFEIENANHVFNGKHPWTQNNLPEETVKAIEKTVEFFQT